MRKKCLVQELIKPSIHHIWVTLTRKDTVIMLEWIRPKYSNPSVSFQLLEGRVTSESEEHVRELRRDAVALIGEVFPGMPSVEQLKSFLEALCYDEQTT